MPIHYRNISTYIALVSFAFAAFMAQPTFASLVVHLLNGGLLAILIWCAHREGYQRAKLVFTVNKKAG